MGLTPKQTLSICLPHSMTVCVSIFFATSDTALCVILQFSPLCYKCNWHWGQQTPRHLHTDSFSSIFIPQISRTPRLWPWGTSPWTAQVSTGAQQVMTWERKTAPLRSQCSVSFGKKEWVGAAFKSTKSATLIDGCCCVLLRIKKYSQGLPTLGTALNLNVWLLVTASAPRVMFQCHSNAFSERPRVVGVMCQEKDTCNDSAEKF